MMKDILSDLKENISGIIGYFVIDDDKNILVHDVPVLMTEAIEKTSKRLHYVINVLAATKPFDRLIIDSENAKLIAIPVDGRILVVIAERNINLPLFKLLSKAVISKIKEVPVNVRSGDAGQDAQTIDVDKIFKLYDALYAIAAEKLTIFYGSGAVEMFGEALEGVREKHSKILSDIGFGEDGKPELGKLKARSKEVSNEELIAGLEELLLAMLEAVKSNAGPNISDEAIDEIIKTRQTLLQEENIQMPPFM